MCNDFRQADQGQGHASELLLLQQMQAKLRRGARAVPAKSEAFSTPQVESDVPTGPLDLGKMRLRQTREMQNCPHGDLLFHGKTWRLTCARRELFAQEGATHGKRAVHLKGSFAFLCFGSDGFFPGQVVQWEELIPPAAF